MGKEKKSKGNSASEVELEEPLMETPLITFDLYFQKLLHFNNKILKHHKPAMRKFAEQEDLLEGTEDQFEQIFKRY